AYSALRAHLEARAGAADAMQREGALAFYREQLREVEAAFELAGGAGTTPATANVPRVGPTRGSETAGSNTGSNKKSNKNLRRWLPLAVGLLAGFVLLAWGLRTLATRESDIGSSPGVASGTSGQASAQLRLRSNLEGAVAQVVDKTSGDTVWQGPADGSPHEMSPGDYAVVVEHPRCPDPWSEEIHLAAGQQIDRLAQNCRQHGLLAMRANVDGARVSIDGRDVGVPDGDETALPIGPHRIRVEREGHEAWEASIDLAAASRVSLQANLAPRAAKRAAVPLAVASPAPRAQPAEPTPERETDRRTHEWHRTAKQYLLTRYDRDQSGQLDSLAEIEAIPCDDWRGLEQSFDAGGLALPMTRFYGFDGTKWVENAFGVTSEMRGEAYLRLKDCGLR
ncbi:MAG: PEGA domain-containing protein, partial [Deltaproteobacteria bacterium]|nr:PEGA domain-containing protein [Deltaproteobacteria bacterium]